MFRTALAIVSIAACWTAAAAAQTLNDPALKLTTHTSGLSSPTGMRFLGDSADEMFVIEKNTGRVQHVQGSTSTTVLDLGVNTSSERGLLGIELDPDFAINGRTYLYYSVNSTSADSSVDAQWTENRLSSFSWNGSTLGSETVLRSFQRSATLSNGPNHDAGPILFGPDDLLYGTTGDLNRSGAEQNQASTASAGVGGVYRLNANGTIPAGNPFAGDANSAFHLWYAYGVRNTFGIAFDPLTGNLWDTENGPNSYDEVNVVAAGFNSGWSKIMGPDSRDPQDTGDLVSLANSAYSDPEFSWLSPIGVTSIAFLANSLLDSKYRDTVLIGDVNTGSLHELHLNPTRDGFVFSSTGLNDLVADNAAEVAALQFGSGFGVTTDIRTGPDGAIYVTSLTQGNIYRIEVAKPWQNPGESLDVDNDGDVIALDALRIINDLNTNGARALTVPQSPDGPPPYIDVNGDNCLTPIDALLVINFVNSKPADPGFAQSFALESLATANVPEPPTMVLAVMGSIWLAVAWRTTRNCVLARR